MLKSRNLVKLTVADFTLRTGYQMGKTPLLPLFAAGLGAGDALLGVIVSVSTLTGMVLKPLVGVLSDRWGRRLWLRRSMCWLRLKFLPGLGGCSHRGVPRLARQLRRKERNLVL